MPRLSQWLIKVAFLYLLLGFTVGALLLAHKGIFLNQFLWRWLPAHMEFLLMGWVVQLTMGVAFWILPRYWKPPRRPKEEYVRLSFVSLNLGIWLVVAGTTFGAGEWALFAGRAAEVVAVILFALHGWARTVSREGQ
ncbi:MAG: hypothetical protein PVH65_12880 [Chloroflexota bacterium]|jgi:hypothetical protein